MTENYTPPPMSATRSGGVPLSTKDQAREAQRFGWNLRCNRCGGWGASWFDGHRPGWGSLALCDPHADELDAEMRRHKSALVELRDVRFEQS
jgi:hypothetical protein